ncbi:hypothetical protein COCOBI_07-5030 [Coccomyxa sp. Obi]|nr:hypothetical protein COCOBI_07-5030 [Coccomyxa sp. Obi]
MDSVWLMMAPPKNGLESPSRQGKWGKLTAVTTRHQAPEIATAARTAFILGTKARLSEIRASQQGRHKRRQPSE